MDSGKIIEIVLHGFFRFFLSGLVFMLFVVLAPSYFIVEVFSTGYGIVKILDSISGYIGNQPTIFVLVTIVVGILLDLITFYRFLTKRVFSEGDENDKSSWFSVKVSIVKAFKIYIDKTRLREERKRLEKNKPKTIWGVIKSMFDDKNKKEPYKSNIGSLADRIHKSFVAVKLPEIDQRIENGRMYPDILSMSLVSIFLSALVFFLAQIIFIFITHKSNCGLPFEMYVSSWFCETINYWWCHEVYDWFHIGILMSILIVYFCFTFYFIISKETEGGISYRSFFLFTIVFAIITLCLFRHIEFLYLLIPFSMSVLIGIYGIKKVKKEFIELNKSTEALIEMAHKKISEKDKSTLDDFYDLLEEMELIRKIEDQSGSSKAINYEVFC